LNKPAQLLSWPVRIAYGVGDFYGGASITIISLLYLFFLTNVIGLQPLLAGTVMLIGRIVDGTIDPLLGLLTDRTRTRWGRRSPYFLWMALPVAVVYVLLWTMPNLDSQTGLFIWCTITYVLSVIVFSTVMTPYAALAPELTPHYDERTVLVNTRMAFSITGALAGATLPKMIIDGFKANPAQGYQVMALIFGLVFTAIWICVFFVMKGREQIRQRSESAGVFQSLRSVLGNRSFRALIGIYLFSFITNDILSANFIYFLTFYLVKDGLFTPVMGALLVSAALSLPVYIRLSKRLSKRGAYFIGAGYWIVVLAFVLLLDPQTSTAVILVVAVLLGLGMGISYAIPWAMLPEVVDVDEVVSGQRQEGLYSGIMTFLRQVSSSVAVFGIGAILQFTGYNASLAIQPPQAVTAIRLINSLVPVVMLACGLLCCWLFPITRQNFMLIRVYLDKRRSGTALSGDEKQAVREVIKTVHGASIEP
jgi:sugar (glycoside-pentoside-hexuronide) transporter